MKPILTALLCIVGFISSGQIRIDYKKLKFKKAIAYYESDPFTGIAKDGEFYYAFKNGVRDGLSLESSRKIVIYKNGIVSQCCLVGKDISDKIYCVDQSEFSANEIVAIENRLYIEDIERDTIKSSEFPPKDRLTVYYGIRLHYKDSSHKTLKISGCEQVGPLEYREYNVTRHCEPGLSDGLYIPSAYAVQCQGQLHLYAALKLNKKMIYGYGLLFVIQD